MVFLVFSPPGRSGSLDLTKVQLFRLLRLLLIVSSSASSGCRGACLDPTIISVWGTPGPEQPMPDRIPERMSDRMSRVFFAAWSGGDVFYWFLILCALVSVLERANMF